VEKSSVERSLDASIKDGTSYAVMAGLGDPTYVGACALFLGASPSAVALLVTVPAFLGACCQLLPPILIERTGKRKALFVWGSLVQALAWIPMIAAPFASKETGYALLFGGWIAYFAGIHFTMSPWTSVMGDLVPPAVRGRYFGRRSALAVLMQFLAMLLSGSGLAIYRTAGHEALGYGVVFAGAFAARLVSVWYLSRMEEPAYHRKKEDSFTLWQFLRRLPESNFAKFVIFVAFLNLSAHFAGCLFIPYWRDQLHYTYWELMAVGAALILVQVPALPFWGRMGDRFGNKKVLVTTSFGIVVLPALWLVSRHIAWAVFLQMWSGFFWSGFNQSVANFLYDAVTPAKRARCAAYLQFIMNCGLLLGGLVGSQVFRVVPVELGPVTLPYAFWTMLLLSFLLRALTLVAFLPRFREVREVPQVGMVEMLAHSTQEMLDPALSFFSGLIPGQRRPGRGRRAQDPATRRSQSIVPKGERPPNT
jgi:MFS family permease